MELADTSAWTNRHKLAAAELAGVGICHYNADFDAISAVTRQPTRAIAPLGSL